MNGPIKPEEVGALAQQIFPADVFKTFNEAIAHAWDGAVAVVRQDVVATVIANRLNIERKDVFDKGYLNIEQAYRDQGWVVVYDKPGYNETYAATFTFSKK